MFYTFRKNGTRDNSLANVLKSLPHLSHFRRERIIGRKLIDRTVGRYVSKWGRRRIAVMEHYS